MGDASLYSDGLPPEGAVPCGLGAALPADGPGAGIAAAAATAAAEWAPLTAAALARAAASLLRDPGAWLVGLTLAAATGASGFG